MEAARAGDAGKGFAMVEETTAASHSLAQEAQELRRLVGRFEIGEIEESADRRAA